MNKYGQNLIKNASKLDALTDACGEVTKLATDIAENNNKSATISLLKRLSVSVDNPTYRLEIKRVAHLVNQSLLEFYGYSTIQTICNPAQNSDEVNRTLQELLDELNA
ncbi:TPA: hypothetical protein ACGO55_002419, partial [Streptococcus suis]